LRQQALAFMIASAMIVWKMRTPAFTVLYRPHLGFTGRHVKRGGLLAPLDLELRDLAAQHVLGHRGVAARAF
jgi:hypothetical protein